MTTAQQLDTVSFPTPHPLASMFEAMGFGPCDVLATLDYPMESPREPTVRESPRWYWVVIRDRRPFDGDPLRVEKLRPYCWEGDVGEGPQRGYGWTDDASNTVASAFASIQPLDDYQAVLCKPAE